MQLKNRLAQFAIENKFRTKGPLCVALVVTQHAKNMGLPLDPDKLLTEGGGQVLGLGSGAVQAVLSRHGITRTLAKEGGRTSRNSLYNMRQYVSLLNQLFANGEAELEEIEKFWITRVHEYFSAQPFKIQMDTSNSLRTVVGHVLKQAEERQAKTPGIYYAGIVMQHLVGSKLECVLGEGVVTHNSYSTADAPTNRSGDFFVGDVAIHVTTTPTEALIKKCRSNLNDGLRPLIVTSKKGLPLAEGLASNVELEKRIDIFEIEQFMATNIYEIGTFESAGCRSAVKEIVTKYNEIVETVETDPSLKIELKL